MKEEGERRKKRGNNRTQVQRKRGDCLVVVRMVFGFL